MEITQEKIYDLTDKQVREEYLKHTISAIENKLGILSTKQTIEDLKAENERLKKQLNDYEKALKEYADEKNWNKDLGGNYNFHYEEKYQVKSFDDFLECWVHHIAPIVYNGFSLAQETLKKWEVK